jgi:hypothetical protein
MLDKNGKKELVRDAITQVLNQNLGVKFEVDAPPSDDRCDLAELPQTARPAATRLEQVAPPPAPATASIRITPELIQSLRESEPLVKTLMDDLGATIIKVE